jgi:hypothetical protein
MRRVFRPTVVGRSRRQVPSSTRSFPVSPPYVDADGRLEYALPAQPDITQSFQNRGQDTFAQSRDGVTREHQVGALPTQPQQH